MKQPILSWKEGPASFLYAGKNQIGVVDTDSFNRFVGEFFPNRTFNVTENTFEDAKHALEILTMRWFEDSFKEKD